MKKFVGYLMVLMIALSACDHDNKPSPKPEEPKPENPGGSKEDPQQQNLTAEEIAQYYNWSTTMTVEAVDALVRSVHEAKKVGSKTIEIKDATLTDRDDTKGTFTLDIREALIDGKKHSQKMAFSGFAIRPSDSEIGIRAYATWKVKGEELFKTFDLDPLYINNKTEMYDTEYLARFVSFISSNTQGQQYILTAEDMKHVKIIDLRYDRAKESITFKIGYKGFSSSSYATLPLRPMDYYDHKVSIVENFAPQKYMRGVFMHLGLYSGHMLSYDHDKYVVELSDNGHQGDDNNNALWLTVSLRDKDSDRELATLRKEVNNFKPLTELKKDIDISSSATLDETLKKKLKGDFTEGKDMSDKLKSGIMNWIKQAQFSYKGEALDYYTKGMNDIISCGSGITQENGDLYLENPRFELVSAVIQDAKLRVTVRLTFANEVAVEGVTFVFVAHGFRNA
ncbi:hypothetical protein [Porphyromonas cangingivalis]|nr:hypothetical protein [Porphyromonas cangingivalis]